MDEGGATAVSAHVPCHTLVHTVSSVPVAKFVYRERAISLDQTECVPNVQCNS